VDAAPALVEYGALGISLLLAIAAIRVLFNRDTRALDRERERADRMEAEVGRLNALIQDRMLPILHESQKAISDVLNERRRDRP
jgi:hypothetical protein